MSYRASDLPHDLRLIYQKFLDLDRRLDAGEVTGNEALRAIERLTVKDAYENTWAIDPYSGGGQFTMTSPTGTVTTHANPANFHSAQGYVDADVPDEEHLYDDEEFAGDYKMKEEKDPESEGLLAKFSALSLGKKILIVAGGLFVALFLVAGATSVLGGGGGGDGEVGVVTDAGVPSTEEAAAAIGGLSRGDVPKTVPNATAVEAEWLRAQMTGVKAQGLMLVDATTEEGGQIVVLNAAGEVVAKAPVDWVKEGEEWSLASVPVFRPATGEEVAPTQSAAPGVTIPTD